MVIDVSRMDHLCNVLAEQLILGNSERKGICRMSKRYFPALVRR